MILISVHLNSLDTSILHRRQNARPNQVKKMLNNGTFVLSRSNRLFSIIYVLSAALELLKSLRLYRLTKDIPQCSI
jgi:hypothetical protein